LNNYIGIDESADDMFGKIMSISDELMFRYYELLTDIPLAEIEKMKQQISKQELHPKDCKQKLAQIIIEFYYDAQAGQKAAEVFAARFSGGTDWDNSDNFEDRVIDKSQWIEGKLWICKVLTLAKTCKSNSDARRLIEQKAVSLNGEVITDSNLELALPQEECLLKVGKKQFIRIIVNG